MEQDQIQYNERNEGLNYAYLDFVEPVYQRVVNWLESRSNSNQKLPKNEATLCSSIEKLLLIKVMSVNMNQIMQVLIEKKYISVSGTVNDPTVTYHKESIQENSLKGTLNHSIIEEKIENFFKSNYNSTNNIPINPVLSTTVVNSKFNKKSHNNFKNSKKMDENNILSKKPIKKIRKVKPKKPLHPLLPHTVLGLIRSLVQICQIKITIPNNYILSLLYSSKVCNLHYSTTSGSSSSSFLTYSLSKSSNSSNPNSLNSKEDSDILQKIKQELSTNTKLQTESGQDLYEFISKIQNSIQKNNNTKKTPNSNSNSNSNLNSNFLPILETLLLLRNDEQQLQFQMNYNVKNKQIILISSTICSEISSFILQNRKNQMSKLKSTSNALTNNEMNAEEKIKNEDVLELIKSLGIANVNLKQKLILQFFFDSVFSCFKLDLNPLLVSKQLSSAKNNSKNKKNSKNKNSKKMEIITLIVLLYLKKQNSSKKSNSNSNSKKRVVVVTNNDSQSGLYYKTLLKYQRETPQLNQEFLKFNVITQQDLELHPNLLEKLNNENLLIGSWEVMGKVFEKNEDLKNEIQFVVLEDEILQTLRDNWNARMKMQEWFCNTTTTTGVTGGVEYWMIWRNKETNNSSSSSSGWFGRRGRRRRIQKARFHLD